MATWTIQEYRTASGQSPFRVFVDGLEDRDLAETRALVKLLAEFGNTLREPRSKALGGGLYELRGSQVRIFYMFRPGRKVVVLDGIVKKQDKIPKDTLRRVRKYQRDVLEKK